MSPSSFFKYLHIFTIIPLRYKAKNIPNPTSNKGIETTSSYLQPFLFKSSHKYTQYATVMRQFNV